MINDMAKKPGPKKMKLSEKATARGVTATDAEWKWFCAQAKANGFWSASAYFRDLVQKMMAKDKG